MIVIGRGIIGNVADEARASTDGEVNELRDGGRLKAGKSTLEKLKWTGETREAARQFEKAFEKNADFALPNDLGVPNILDCAKGNILWVGPIVYSDVLPIPLKYEHATPGSSVVGIVALGTLQLPDIGGIGSTKVESGTVAYFRGSDSIKYDSCGGGRGILFHIKS